MVIYLQITSGSGIRMQILLLAETLLLLAKLAPSAALLPCAQVLGNTDAFSNVSSIKDTDTESEHLKLSL